MSRQVCGTCMLPFVEELTCGCLSLREAELEAQLAEKDAEIARLQKEQQRLEWLGNYLWSLTGDTWPRNETIDELKYCLFYEGFCNWRYAIDDELRKARESSDG